MNKIITIKALTHTNIITIKAYKNVNKIITRKFVPKSRIPENFRMKWKLEFFRVTLRKADFFDHLTKWHYLYFDENSLLIFMDKHVIIRLLK